MQGNVFARGRLLLPTAAAVVVILTGAGSIAFGVCGPFTDVAADAFCPFVLQIFYFGITTGTTPTTYDPTANVSRLQMAAFLSRSVDATLRRGSRRAALGQHWTPQALSPLDVTTVGNVPGLVQSDGSDVWVANQFDGTVSRVRGSDARLLETWTGATGSVGIAMAFNRVVVTGNVTGNLYMIDPSQPAGAVTTVATSVGSNPLGIVFDGLNVWTANGGTGFNGSVSIVKPDVTIPWSVSTVTVATGATSPQGLVYDGANVWVTDFSRNTLQKLDASAGVLQTVTVGGNPRFPVFDGTNVWVPNFGSNSVTVVRASSGAVLQTLTGNGLDHPSVAGFDGARILVSNPVGAQGVSYFKAADLSPLGFVATGGGSGPFGVCSDGIRFWVSLSSADQLARF